MKTCKALICATFLGLLLLSLTACGNSETPAGGVNKPEDIPEGDSALLVQTIEMSGSAVYITALSGRYEASGGFTSSGDQVFTFKLCKDEGDFNGYFWEPAVAGASSRRTYYGARSFWTDYYRAAVKLDAFHPVACSYDFNEDGELIELYQCADLSYQHPEPEFEPEFSPEADLLESNFNIKNTVRHDTFEDFLENCATEGVREAMKQFPSDSFERLYYFTTYYLYDDDLNFPTSVIAFEEDGLLFCYSGSEAWNPFASFSDDRIFDGNGMATVSLQKDGDLINTCNLRYNSYTDEFALSPVSPVEQQLYHDMLTKVTGARYKCVKSGAVSIWEDIVHVAYTSYDMSIGKYTLSEPGILSERHFNFEPSEQEFVNYSSDSDAPGGAMVASPAFLGLEFDLIGSGRTVFSIFGDDDETLFSVEIEVNEDGAFFPNESS